MASDGEGRGIEVVETHISTLFFTGERVFKLKKSVGTGFLDFTSPTARRAACHREVELNRRLAPDVYLGVADLTMGGTELDHFVVMTQLPPSRRLSALLDDQDIGAHLERIARIVAEFHQRADRGPEIDEAASPAALRELWRTGIEQLDPFVPGVLAEDEVHRLAQLVEHYLAGRGDLLEGRIASGRVCDGHGDLLAEDVFCMPDGPRILDCLEFDDQLRYGDVLADVAFLAMDLEHHGRADLGQLFLDEYRRFSGDEWPASLAHFHIAYRAHVRSKVACLRHAQGAPPSADLARALHSLALDHMERARVQLVLVGGAPGTGKSTLAAGLSRMLDAELLSSDDLRADMIPDEAGAAGKLHAERYAPERVAEVYDELMERAGALLRNGRRVVLDASWSSAEHRDAARQVARAASAELHEVCCAAPPELAARRIEERAAKGRTTSQVTPEIAAALAAERDPWPEAVTIDTRNPPEGVLAAALEAVGSPPHG